MWHSFFRLGIILIAKQDFMVLQLRPSGFPTSPFTEHKHAHSIRLVTDSYRDLNDYTTLLNL